MKKSFRFIAAFLSTLMVITLFSFVALAEPTDVSSAESSETAGEQSSEAITPEDSSSTVTETPAESSEESSENAGSSETVESSEIESSDTESSEPETSDTESSEPETSDTESSKPETSEPSNESSEPETSKPETSKPESSDTESSKPETSDTESSEPETSDTETSKPETSDPGTSKPDEDTVNFTFVLDGPGKYVIRCASDKSFSHTVVNTIENTDTDTQGGRYSETIKLKKGVTYNFTVTPALNYELDGQVWIEGSQNFSATDSPRYIKATVDTTITQKFKPAPGGTQAPTTNSVQVNVGSGGSVTAGDREIASGGGSKIVVNAGQSLEFVITPDEGYELDSFRVDDTDIQVTDNKFTLENIVANATVRILFKSVTEEDLSDAIKCDDIDWNTYPIRKDVSGKKVLLEVFEKISNMPKDGSYVEFYNEHGSIFVPCGVQINTTSAAATMSFECLENGNVFENIRQAFVDVNSADVPFKVYSFNVGMALPEGTLVSFKLGDKFASSTAMYLLFDSGSATDKFYANSDIPPESDALGNSGKFSYNGESVVIISKEFPGKYTVNTVVLNGVGGTVEPNGAVEVPIGQDCTVVINAADGYTIKQITVNGVAIVDAEGKQSFTKEIFDIKENYTIEVEFKSETVVSVPDDVITNEEKEDLTVLVILIIVFVAITGAAALFIVKWRQEKF